MRHSIFLFSILLLVACSTNSKIVTIPANQSIDVDSPVNDFNRVLIKNKSLRQIEVKVLEKQSKYFISGFGLGIKGKASLSVAQNGQLVLQNTYDKPVKARIVFKKQNTSKIVSKGKLNTRTTTANTKEYITFTLANNTAKSIPLIIPNVMNPNLSPFSKSGVDLKVGQEILFRANGKKYVLITVDNSIQDGAILNVGSLMKDKRKELGL